MEWGVIQWFHIGVKMACFGPSLNNPPPPHKKILKPPFVVEVDFSDFPFFAFFEFSHWRARSPEDKGYIHHTTELTLFYIIRLVRLVRLVRSFIKNVHNLASLVRMMRRLIHNNPALFNRNVDLYLFEKTDKQLLRKRAQ